MIFSNKLTSGQKKFIRKFLHNKVALFSLAIIGIVMIAAIFAPLIAPYNPARQFINGLTTSGMPKGPGHQFKLGADLLGRDLLTRLIFGARVSMLIGIVANGVAVLLGTLLGTLAGYHQKKIGTAIMRFTDLMMAFPALLLAIALTSILRPSMWIVALVIALVNWVQIARVIYAQVMTIRANEFIEAAIAVGASTRRIIFRHVLPHLIPTLLVYGTLGISTTVLLESTLSFLGVGVQPPTPSWGGIINESQTYFLDAPWLVFFPGLAILLTSLAFNLLGDALRDCFGHEGGNVA
ncbi:MAG TPA: peptide ABC transporter permease [Firmicutes bacterium]|jgi:peptide/nickel transport system permease protein|nr:peptide ABC transporter permease [Bacillota bacterium]